MLVDEALLLVLLEPPCQIARPGNSINSSHQP